MNNTQSALRAGQRDVGPQTLYLLLILFGAAVISPAAEASDIVTREDAARLGLHRAWVTQVELDPAQSRVADIAQDDGQLFVLTDSGSIHAIDAETGATMWAAQYGNPDYPSMGPGVNDGNVSFVNGSQLYLISRETGRKLWQTSTKGSPAAGPSMSADRVFVPLGHGVIESVQIAEPERPSWLYHSEGLPLTKPLVTNRVVCWTTDHGFLYGGDLTRAAVVFCLETRDAVVSSPVYREPFYYCGSLDGEVYALDERSGKLAWRYPTGYAIEQSPIVIDDHVYVTPNHVGLLCLSAETGDPVWRARGMVRFVAAGAKRVYAVDRYNRLHALDVETGRSTGVLPTATLSVQVPNPQTDRIYLGTDQGLLQCFHETDLAEPIHHGEPKPEDADPAAPPAADVPADPDAAPADLGTVPPVDAAPDDAAEGDAENPFAAEDDNPF